MAAAPFYLTDEGIGLYFQSKLDSGVSPVAVGKYKEVFRCLLDWLGDDRELSAQRLQEWRHYIEHSGFSKNTVQRYVAVVNTFLRTVGHAELCIPKPLRSDLRGKTFGYLTVIEPTAKRNRKDVIWRCSCKCGKEVEVPAVLLKGGNTTSCGCLKTEILQYHNRYQEGTELRQAMNEKIRNPNSVSGYVGVQPKRDKWIAYINYKGVRYNLGTYSKMEDAVKARARAKEAVMEDAARIYAESEHLYADPPRRPPKPPKELPVAPETVAVRARKSNNTSGYAGVKPAGKRWKAELSCDGTRYHLGLYDDFEAAVEARKRAEALTRAGDRNGLEAMSISRTTYKTKKADSAKKHL